MPGVAQGARMTEVSYPSRADGTLQPARFLRSRGRAPMPLLVGLHTWSADYRQDYLPEIEASCAAQGWAYIYPNFRGPNWTPAATGSELVLADVLSAVDFARQEVCVDEERIYLVGGSGGGYHALLLAGRVPDLWAAVSAWVPISDLTAWYHECCARGLEYATHIVQSCGGAPGTSAEVDAQLRRRSPLTWLHQATGVHLDINAGIHDGHQGSVPVSHALMAFNAVADAADRIAAADIRHVTECESVPPGLQGADLDDPVYGRRRPLFRRTSGRARVTLFDGGHEVVEGAAIEWLGRQRRSGPGV